MPIPNQAPELEGVQDDHHYGPFLRRKKPPLSYLIVRQYGWLWLAKGSRNTKVQPGPENSMVARLSDITTDVLPVLLAGTRF